MYLESHTQTLSFKYDYLDKTTEKSVVKGFALPRLRLDLTEAEVETVLKTVATLVDRPTASRFYGEWVDKRRVVPVINKQ